MLGRSAQAGLLNILERSRSKRRRNAGRSHALPMYSNAEMKTRSFLDNAGLFAMVLAVRLALHERRKLSWVSHFAGSNTRLSKVVLDSFYSDSRMRHRHPRSFGDGRKDVGAAICATKRPPSRSGGHRQCIREHFHFAVRQSGAPGISVLDPTVAHDRLLSLLPGSLGSSPSQRRGFGGAAPVAPPHGCGPNVHR